MNFDNYENYALQFVAFDTSRPLQYLLPALTEEVGELQGIFAKNFRKYGNYELAPHQQEEVLSELGDILWNLAMITTFTGNDLDHVARNNIDKLSQREVQGTIATIQRRES